MGGRRESEANDTARGRRAVVIHIAGLAPPADALQPSAEESPHAIHAEMDAQPDRSGEAEKHLLAPCLGGIQLEPGEDGRPVREPALGAAGADGVAGELRFERAGQAVDGVTFGRGSRSYGLCGGTLAAPTGRLFSGSKAMLTPDVPK